MELDAASTLVVSQDVDVAIDVHRHSRVRMRLGEMQGLAQSQAEPSVWIPAHDGLMDRQPDMPDPEPLRRKVATLLAELHGDKGHA